MVAPAIAMPRSNRYASTMIFSRLVLFAALVASLSMAIVFMACDGAAGAAERASVYKPDFSAIRTRAGARRLETQGELVKVFIFPSEVGGQDIPENIFYIPPYAMAARSLIVGTLIRFVRDGLIDNMTVKPEYLGKSIVPTRIVFHTSKRGEAGSFQPTIEIW